MVLKVNEKEIQAAFLKFILHLKPRSKLHICKQRGRRKYRFKDNRQLQYSLLSDILYLFDSLDFTQIVFSHMVDVGQKGIGDPHRIEGIIALQENYENPKLTIGGGSIPVMKMKDRKRLDQKVTIAMVTQFRETLQLVQLDLGELGVMTALLDFMDLWQWWPLHLN